MSAIASTIIRQIATSDSALSAMTGAQLCTGPSGLSMTWTKRVGRKGLTHLLIEYVRATDDYTVRTLRMNRKTFQFSELETLEGITAENLKEVCEDRTGLYFTLR